MQVSKAFQGGRICFNFADAKFKWGAKTLVMSYHNYCGPMFEMVTGNGDLVDFSDFGGVDSGVLWDALWKQYNGWWKAKGEALYGYEANQPTDD